MAMFQGRVLLLVLIWVVGSESIRPEDHGLIHEKDPGAIPPAMAAFFKGRPEVELPEALNTTEPTWNARITPPGPTSKQTVHTRTALIATGLVCGFVGIGLLAAAVVLYLSHAHRAEAGGRLGSGLGLVQRRKSWEIQLGC